MVFLKLLELALLIFKLLLVEFLKFFLALTVMNLQLIHLLLVIVFLLGFLHLQLLILLIQVIQLIGLVSFHLVDTFLVEELFLAKRGIDLVRLVFHFCFKILLFLTPVFHSVLADKDYASHLILDLDTLHTCLNDFLALGFLILTNLFWNFCRLRLLLFIRHTKLFLFTVVYLNYFVNKDDTICPS